jgi:hypothetical protein
MNINTVAFVAPNLTCREARGGRIPAVGRNRRATKPQAKFGATLRAAVLFGTGFMFMTTKLSTHQTNPEANDKSIG